MAEVKKDHNSAESSGGTKYTIAQADIDLLRANGVSEDDIAHCLKVAFSATFKQWAISSSETPLARSRSISAWAMVYFVLPLLCALL